MDNLKPLNLTDNEELYLRHWVEELKSGQEMEIEKLSINFIGCNNPYTLAKVHSDYVKDWERTEKQLERQVGNDIFPPEVSADLRREMIKFSGLIMKRKLEAVRVLYERKFEGSIYDYLGTDGKLKGMFSAMRDAWKNR